VAYDVQRTVNNYIDGFTNRGIDFYKELYISGAIDVEELEEKIWAELNRKFEKNSYDAWGDVGRSKEDFLLRLQGR